MFGDSWPEGLVADGKPSSFVPRPEFRAQVLLEPGHAIHWRDGSNYGVHSFGIRVLLHGPAASMQFLMWTGIVPELVQGHYLPEFRHDTAPMAADLGYHADSPQYEDQPPFECEYRPSGRCFYDGSSLAADPVLALLLAKGGNAVLEALQSSYDAHDWVRAEVP